MPHRPYPPALTVVAQWVLGTVLVTWRYLWATTPLHRGGERSGDDRDRPPPIPGEMFDDRVQLSEDGYGPLFHRRFMVRIASAQLDADRLMLLLCRDFRHFVPKEVVGIRSGQSPARAGGLGLADELVVVMPGPWNGPVRVIRRDRDHLGLVTLRGHMEAGQVHFRARGGDGAPLEFEVELWARAGSRLVDLLYSRLRVAKEAQLNMWVRFCLGAVEASGGRLMDGVHIATRRLDSPDGTPVRTAPRAVGLGTERPDRTA
ncbi:hypothetical protein OIB37_03490 [Streptomyces sp. NBC_00820]|uniref:hypothetical protein n=1 Tax=Streptomyces sp. NBC_00820 TaxID=2975842 RepID=UPI002ED15F3D|nr:hypothetical protein OIB37_03490 [Streptomyces sp. NBC_00820]